MVKPGMSLILVSCVKRAPFLVESGGKKLISPSKLTEYSLFPIYTVFDLFIQRLKY